MDDAILSNDSLEAVEVSSKAATIVRTVSERVDEFGGAALIADYGNDYPAQDSFRYPNFSLIVDKVLRDPTEKDRAGSSVMSGRRNVSDTPNSESKKEALNIHSRQESFKEK